MNGFAIESIHIAKPAQHVFAFIADRTRLPEWTAAFRDVDEHRAVMRTHRGEVSVGLDVEASERSGIIDWTMRFPDGTTAQAFSRVVALGEQSTVYAFILPAPAAPLEQLEGNLHEQRQALRAELSKLRDLLELK